MNLPTREECFELLKKYRFNFKLGLKHVEAVNRVSVFLAKRLIDAGENVDIDLVDRASLLHDIAKTIEIEKGFSGVAHAKLGCDILKKEGYPELGEIVKKHVMPYLIKQKVLTWEEKIIQYADDRAKDEMITSLDDRYNYLLKKHKDDKIAIQEILKSKPFAKKIEKEIFDKIKIKPEDLVKYID